jgi:hypothetical protein
MFDDLFDRIRAAAPSLLALSRQDTARLKAHLDSDPEQQVYYYGEVVDGVLDTGEYTLQSDREWLAHLWATLAYSQDELERLASAEPQPATTDPAPSAEQVVEPPNKIAMALALLVDHPDWTDKAIAEAVGCSGAYLSNNRRYRAARKAIKGQGQDDRQRSRKHRGSAMDEYADALKEPLPVVTCSAKGCDDPAGKNEQDELLTHKGKPYCRECWLEVKGLPQDYLG